jgi:hypothetical protein
VDGLVGAASTIGHLVPSSGLPDPGASVPLVVFAPKPAMASTLPMIAPSTTTGARGQRVGSDWDRLDAGEDPTLRDDSQPT